MAPLLVFNTNAQKIGLRSCQHSSTLQPVAIRKVICLIFVQNINILINKSYITWLLTDLLKLFLFSIMKYKVIRKIF